MEANGGPEAQRTGASDPAKSVEDLRQRLQATRVELLATRSAARLLARELALTRRLLSFTSEGAAGPRAKKSAAASPVQHAVLLTNKTFFHLDTCARRDAHTILTGWAFQPIPEWDARATTVTILLWTGSLTYSVATVPAPRPDVAAHFAAQGPNAAGGAAGLDAAGFRCEIINDSLPEGVDLEIVLRLECAGVVCEQPTGQYVRL